VVAVQYKYSTAPPFRTRRNLKNTSGSTTNFKKSPGNGKSFFARSVALTVAHHYSTPDKRHRSPHTSKAYRTALTTPPDGKPSHTFHLANSSDEEPQAKFSRLTHSTLYRIITGHAFTGEYTQRFFPQHTPEQIACPCGEPLQTIEHVLFQCHHFTAARRRHLTVSGRPRSFPQLLENPERARALLRFLEETRACSKPRAEWEPG
jgi:hypothetical protein